MSSETSATSGPDPRTSKRRVALISVHYVRSERRAGFHWLAEAFRDLGWDVTFVTTAFSHLSRLKLDHRFKYGIDRRAGRLEDVEPGLRSYVWFTPYHPLNRLPRILQPAMTPLFRRYADLPTPGLQAAIAPSDLVIFESAPGLVLADRVRTWAPNARLVYRVSDDLRVQRAHPVTIEAERQALPLFDLVSVPSEGVGRAIGDLPTVRLHRHAIDRASFDAPSVDPYSHHVEANAVFVGVAQLDTESLRMAARELPGWRFHVIGPLRVPRVANIVGYGEMPFAATVPYIVHADVGLGMRVPVAGAEVFSDSLKIVQYTYARLPFVVPQEMQSGRAHSFSYVSRDASSIRQALLAARRFDRSQIDRSGILDWRDLARELAGPLATSRGADALAGSSLT